jgi:hypothetical protein
LGIFPTNLDLFALPLARQSAIGEYDWAFSTTHHFTRSHGWNLTNRKRALEENELSEHHFDGLFFLKLSGAAI